MGTPFVGADQVIFDVTDSQGSARIWLGFFVPDGLAGNVLTLQAVTRDVLDRKLIWSAPFTLTFV